MNPEPSKADVQSVKNVETEKVNVLTSRKKEVACLLADGITPTEIAAQLCLSKHTVHEHIRHTYERLDCHHRGQLIALILRSEICIHANN